MHCGDDMRRELGGQGHPALLGNAERPPQQRLSRGGAQDDDYLRLHRRDFRLKPWEAGLDLH